MKFAILVTLCAVGACHVIGGVSDAEFTAGSGGIAGNSAAGAGGADPSAGGGGSLAGPGGSQGGAGGQGGSGGGVGGQGGAGCPGDGMAPASPAVQAPWSCNVATRLCTLDCNATDECDEGTTPIVCPPGWECRVRCRGQSSCKGNTITCGDYPCTIECDARDACQDTIINCSAASCAVACSGHPTACSGNMSVNCLADYRCTMDCQNPANAPPNVNNCQDACECVECP